MFYVLTFYSEAVRSWVSFLVSSERGKLEYLAERMILFLNVVVRIVEVSSDDDDVIERALLELPAPRSEFAELELHAPGDPNG